MNLTILSYFIYVVITLYIIVYIGKLCHKNGRIFIIKIFQDNVAQADTTNNILLVAYYLFNIGYAITTLSIQSAITSVEMLLLTIGTRVGLLIIILAITHYFNIMLIYLFSKKINKPSLTSKM